MNLSMNRSESHDPANAGPVWSYAHQQSGFPIQNTGVSLAPPQDGTRGRAGATVWVSTRE